MMKDSYSMSHTVTDYQIFESGFIANLVSSMIKWNKHFELCAEDTLMPKLSPCLFNSASNSAELLVSNIIEIIILFDAVIIKIKYRLNYSTLLMS